MYLCILFVLPNLFFLLHKSSLYCVHPSGGELIEKQVEIHKNMTLGEATERAYKVGGMTASNNTECVLMHS